MDTGSRKPGHPKGWGFDSSSYRVHNFTQRYQAGVFRSFLSRKRTGSLCGNQESRGGRSNRPSRISVRARWPGVPVKHSSTDMGGSIPSAETVRQPQGWSRGGHHSRAGEPEPRSTSGLVTGFSIQGWGINTPTRYERQEATKEGRSLAEPSASGPGASTRVTLIGCGATGSTLSFGLRGSWFEPRQPSIVPVSSVEERQAVNLDVVGSNPARGARRNRSK